MWVRDSGGSIAREHGGVTGSCAAEKGLGVEYTMSIFGLEEPEGSMSINGTYIGPQSLQL